MYIKKTPGGTCTGMYQIITLGNQKSVNFRVAGDWRGTVYNVYVLLGLP